MESFVQDALKMAEKEQLLKKSTACGAEDMEDFGTPKIVVVGCGGQTHGGPFERGSEQPFPLREFGMVLNESRAGQCRAHQPSARRRYDDQTNHCCHQGDAVFIPLLLHG